MKSSDSNESERDEEQMSQNTNSNSNSASITVTGPTGVTRSRVIKFGYKEFPVKEQRSKGCRVQELQQAHSGQSERRKCFHKVSVTK